VTAKPATLADRSSVIGRPPGKIGIPQSAQDVARVLSDGEPTAEWRFSQIRQQIHMLRPGGSPKYLDVVVARGVYYLVKMGYVDCVSRGRYRWTSIAWGNLAMLEDVLWSIREALGHLAEIGKYRGRPDSTVEEVTYYVRLLEGFAPEVAHAVLAEVRSRVEQSGSPVALPRGALAQEYPTFEGRTGIIQDPRLKPPSAPRCVTCGHTLKSHRVDPWDDELSWTCDPARVGPLANTRCGCSTPKAGDRVGKALLARMRKRADRLVTEVERERARLRRSAAPPN
jgi:hypothetical protein